MKCDRVESSRFFHCKVFHFILDVKGRCDKYTLVGHVNNILEKLMYHCEGEVKSFTPDRGATLCAAESLAN